MLVQDLGMEAPISQRSDQASSKKGRCGTAQTAYPASGDVLSRALENPPCDGGRHIPPDRFEVHGEAVRSGGIALLRDFWPASYG